MTTVLIVDDEQDILEFLNYNLSKEGYHVLQANNGMEALKVVQSIKPELVILDLMMPELDGIETCKQMRKLENGKNSVIVFLSARSEDFTQIAALEAGADDYITKPIKIRLLITKLKALMRRSGTPEITDKNIIQVNDLLIDCEKYQVFFKEQSYNLPKKEFELLVLMAGKPNKVFTRDEIFSRIWGDQVIVTDRTIDVHIRKIREKLGDNIITTVKGVGYKLSADE